jgi:hypothetical protein
VKSFRGSLFHTLHSGRATVAEMAELGALTMPPPAPPAAASVGNWGNDPQVEFTRDVGAATTERNLQTQAKSPRAHSESSQLDAPPSQVPS